MAVPHNTVQVPAGVPDGATVGLYDADAVEPDRRLNRAPSATPLDTATVSADGKVTFSVSGRGVLAQGRYAIHATANGREHWGSFQRGTDPKESQANYEREQARRKRNRK